MIRVHWQALRAWYRTNQELRALVRDQHDTIVDLTTALNESVERETILVAASSCRSLSEHLRLSAQLQRAQTDLAIATGCEAHTASLRSV